MADINNSEGFFYAGYPATSFSFSLRVEAAYDIPVKAVRGFAKNNNYEKIQQGGVNDYVVMKRKPIQEPFTFQVERYISNVPTDPLANGAELILPVFLTVDKQFGDAAARVYMFTGCVVTGKEYGELNAEKPGLATEIVTIAYRELFILPNITALGS